MNTKWSQLFVLHVLSFVLSYPLISSAFINGPVGSGRSGLGPRHQYPSFHPAVCPNAAWAGLGWMISVTLPADKTIEAFWFSWTCFSYEQMFYVDLQPWCSPARTSDKAPCLYFFFGGGNVLSNGSIALQQLCWDRWSLPNTGVDPKQRETLIKSDATQRWKIGLQTCNDFFMTSRWTLTELSERGTALYCSAGHRLLPRVWYLRNFPPHYICCWLGSFCGPDLHRGGSVFILK